MKKAISFAVVLITGIMVCTAASAAPKSVNQAKAKTKAVTKTGVVTGQLGIREVGPMFGGVVLFFDKAAGSPPSPTQYWRVPTHVFKTDDNAQFKAELPAGEYYIGAIERTSGEDSIASPREGEYYLIHQDRNGRPRTISVKTKKKVNVGLLSDAKLFSRSSLQGDCITAIEGTIRNRKGEPVEGVMVLAFSSTAPAGRPLFASERSDKDGRYQLRLSGSGEYHLKAQANMGGAPGADGLMGVYRAGEAVYVQSSAVAKDVDITVTPVTAPKPKP